jgi:hypothetical protein
MKNKKVRKKYLFIDTLSFYALTINKQKMVLSNIDLALIIQIPKLKLK